MQSLPFLRNRQPSSLLRTLLGITSLIVLGPASGCYIQPGAPPPARYECDSDGDCKNEESCHSGLCQRTCTTLNAQEDCPSDQGFAGCFNGFCTNLCNIDDDECSDPQECHALPDELQAAAASMGAGTTAMGFGFCGELCVPDEKDSCPEGELCLEGWCLPLPDGSASAEGNSESNDSESTGEEE